MYSTVDPPPPTPYTRMYRTFLYSPQARLNLPYVQPRPDFPDCRLNPKRNGISSNLLMTEIQIQLGDNNN